MLTRRAGFLWAGFVLLVSGCLARSAPPQDMPALYVATASRIVRIDSPAQPPSTVYAMPQNRHVSHFSVRPDGTLLVAVDPTSTLRGYVDWIAARGSRRRIEYAGGPKLSFVSDDGTVVSAARGAGPKTVDIFAPMHSHPWKVIRVGSMSQAYFDRTRIYLCGDDDFTVVRKSDGVIDAKVHAPRLGGIFPADESTVFELIGRSVHDRQAIVELDATRGYRERRRITHAWRWPLAFDGERTLYVAWTDPNASRYVLEFPDGATEPKRELRFSDEDLQSLAVGRDHRLYVGLTPTPNRSQRSHGSVAIFDPDTSTPAATITGVDAYELHPR